MIEIERFADDRYRLRFRGQVMTVDAQALRDLYDWALLHMRELEQEARHSHGGVCVECERTVTALNSMGVCEGCVMQAAIDAIHESEY